MRLVVGSVCGRRIDRFVVTIFRLMTGFSGSAPMRSPKVSGGAVAASLPKAMSWIDA